MLELITYSKNRKNFLVHNTTTNAVRLFSVDSVKKRPANCVDNKYKLIDALGMNRSIASSDKIIRAVNYFLPTGCMMQYEDFLEKLRYAILLQDTPPSYEHYKIYCERLLKIKNNASYRQKARRITTQLGCKFLAYVPEIDYYADTLEEEAERKRKEEREKRAEYNRLHGQWHDLVDSLFEIKAEDFVMREDYIYSVEITYRLTYRLDMSTLKQRVLQTIDGFMEGVVEELYDYVELAKTRKRSKTKDVRQAIIEIQRGDYECTKYRADLAYRTITFTVTIKKDAEQRKTHKLLGTENANNTKLFNRKFR